MFLQKYVDNFSSENFAKSISLENFEIYKSDFKKINSNSSIRNIFDSYIKIFEKWIQGNKNDFEIEKEIWFAKIWYQEQRWLLPANKRNPRKRIEEKNSFLEFLRAIYKKLNNPKMFKQFLEVFVAYHKYFTWKN